MATCKECGSEYEVGVKDCCSEECFRKIFKKELMKQPEMKNHTLPNFPKMMHKVIQF